MKVATGNGDSAAWVRSNWALHARIAEISPSAMLRSFYLNLLEITESHLLAVMPADEQLRNHVTVVTRCTWHWSMPSPIMTCVRWICSMSTTLAVRWSARPQAGHKWSCLLVSGGEAVVDSNCTADRDCRCGVTRFAEDSLVCGDAMYAKNVSL